MVGVVYLHVGLSLSLHLPSSTMRTSSVFHHLSTKQSKLPLPPQHEHNKHASGSPSARLFVDRGIISKSSRRAGGESSHAGRLGDVVEPTQAKVQFFQDLLALVQAAQRFSQSMEDVRILLDHLLGLKHRHHDLEQRCGDNSDVLHLFSPAIHCLLQSTL